MTAINFGAGPGKIPEEVLKEAKEEFLSYPNVEFSVTELSHRSEAYAQINQNAQDDLRELLNVPENYKILFMHGGGQGLFSAVAMNLIGINGIADYAVAGIWSNVAATEAKKYGQINMVFPQPHEGAIPNMEAWKLTPNASYVYYCDNETIQGVEYPFVPDTKGVPLVADMSSNILTRKIDVSKFGVIIAAVQKNLGTAGLGIAIVRDDLLGKHLSVCPAILNFELISEYNSILNTPPIFSVYLLGKVLKWTKRHGGVEAMEKQCGRKRYSMGTTYQLRYSNETLRLSSTIPAEVLNYTLYNIIKASYEESSENNTDMDKIQSKLRCCGVIMSTDYVAVPSSCCPQENCDVNEVYGYGCLRRIQENVAWHKNISLSIAQLLLLLYLFNMAMVFSVSISDHFRWKSYYRDQIKQKS